MHVFFQDDLKIIPGCIKITQVGACIVTPSPHRMVALGYNGMPDGRGFKDVEMKWDKQKTDYGIFY